VLQSVQLLILTLRTVRHCLVPSAVNVFVQFTSGSSLDVRRVKKTFNP